LGDDVVGFLFFWVMLVLGFVLEKLWSFWFFFIVCLVFFWRSLVCVWVLGFVFGGFFVFVILWLNGWVWDFFCYCFYFFCGFVLGGYGVGKVKCVKVLGFGGSEWVCFFL